MLAMISNLSRLNRCDTYYGKQAMAQPIVAEAMRVNLWCERTDNRTWQVKCSSGARAADRRCYLLFWCEFWRNSPTRT
jgi:hypothetical protein